MVKLEDMDGCVLFPVTVLQAIAPNRFLGTNGQEYELRFMDALENHAAEDRENARRLLENKLAGHELSVGARPVPAGTRGPTVLRLALDMKTDEDYSESLPFEVQKMLQGG